MMKATATAARAATQALVRMPTAGPAPAARVAIATASAAAPHPAAAAAAACAAKLAVASRQVSIVPVGNAFDPSHQRITVKNNRDKVSLEAFAAGALPELKTAILGGKRLNTKIIADFMHIAPHVTDLTIELNSLISDVFLKGKLEGVRHLTLLPTSHRLTDLGAILQMGKSITTVEVDFQNRSTGFKLDPRTEYPQLKKLILKNLDGTPISWVEANDFWSNLRAAAPNVEIEIHNSNLEERLKAIAPHFELDPAPEVVKLVPTT